MHRTLIAATLATLALPVAAALADGFQTVKDRKTFLSLVQGRDLKRTGITLQVAPDGQITGRAMGRDVTGAWKWAGGYFCRDLFWGQRDLGPNCQMVKVKDGVVRFIADEGKGIYADMRLE